MKYLSPAIFVFYVLMLLVLFMIVGCEEQQILAPVQSAFFDEEPIRFQPQPSTIDKVPPKIAGLLWGDLDTKIEHFLRTHKEYKQFGGDKAEFFPVLSLSIEELGLRLEKQNHYTKYVSAGGIAIIGGWHVPDRAFHASHDVIMAMTQKHPELRERLTPEQGFRIMLFPGWWGSASLPEVKPHRKSPGTPEPVAWCNFLNYCAIPMSLSTIPDVEGQWLPGLRIFSHEFAHALHGAIEEVYPTFNTRLEVAYTQASENQGGYWGIGSYAMTNTREYWAESVKEWFFTLSSPNNDWIAYNRFLENDPLMLALLTEYFDLVYLRDLEWEAYDE